VIRAFQFQPLNIVRIPKFEIQLAPMQAAPVVAGQQKPRRSLQPSNLTVRIACLFTRDNSQLYSLHLTVRTTQRLILLQPSNLTVRNLPLHTSHVIIHT
jgi:hypothetical protein